MSNTTTDIAPSPSTDDDLEFERELAERGPNWPARILTGAVVLTLTFAGGAWVQEQFLTDDSASASGLPSGLPAGLPAGLADAIGGGGGGLPAGLGASTTDDLPAVVGTVVSVDGNTVTVKDLGGNKRTVVTSEATDVTRTTDIAVGQLKAGTSITVRGDTNASGTVKATEIQAN